MNTRSDDELGQLLTRTFAAHEADADIATAERIAHRAIRPVRRHWSLVAVAAAVLLVIAGGAIVATRHESKAARGLGNSAGPSVSPTAENLADRLIASVPAPPGSEPAVTTGRSSTPGSEGLVPTYPSVTRTLSFSVPMSYRAVSSWYDAHLMRSVRERLLPGSAVRFSEGQAEWWERAVASGYEGAYFSVGYSRTAPKLTAVQVEVTLSAHRMRAEADTFVPAGVTSIEITPQWAFLGKAADRGRVVTSSKQIAAVVAAFDLLPASSMDDEQIAELRGPSQVNVFALTFHWPGHTLVVDPGMSRGFAMSLTLDGRRLSTRLRATPAFGELLAQTASRRP